MKQLRLKEHQHHQPPTFQPETPSNWVDDVSSISFRWVGMQDQEAAEKAKAAELERRKVQELRLARHRKLQKEADVAAKRRCGRGGG